MNINLEVVAQIEAIIRKVAKDGEFHSCDLNFNVHHCCYEKTNSTEPHRGYTPDRESTRWSSDDAYQRAIERDVIWTCKFSNSDRMFDKSGKATGDPSGRADYASDELYDILAMLGATDLDKAEVDKFADLLMAQCVGEYTSFYLTLDEHKGCQATKYVDGEWVPVPRTINELLSAIGSYDENESREWNIEHGGFVNAEEYDKCHELDTVWDFHCYANTPVGFYTLRASTLTAITTELE